MKRFLFIFVLTCTIFSCDSGFKPATFKTSSIDTKYEVDISATFDEATGNNKLSKTINFNIEKAIIGTLSDIEKKTNLQSVLEDFNTEYLEFKKGFPDEGEPNWELYIETEKIYQSEEIISIAISTYEFKGGAHGNDKIKFLNLNAKTGDVYNTSNIIENSDDFKRLAKTHFVKSMKVDENLKIEDFFFGKPFQLPENIGFSEEGLILLYNVYEVASYDKGYTEFVIPFEEAKTYLKVH